MGRWVGAPTRRTNLRPSRYARGVDILPRSNSNTVHLPLQRPRQISGTVPFSGLPHPWRIAHRGPDLLLISNERQMLRSALAIAGVMTMGFGALVLLESISHKLQLTPPQWIACALLAVLSIGGVIAFLVSAGKRETARGPWLIWNARRQTLELPRRGITLKREQLLSLDLVVATTPGSARPHSSDFPVAEFQIVFEENGEQQFLAVVGAQHARVQLGSTLSKDIETIATVIGVPMRRVEIG